MSITHDELVRKGIKWLKSQSGKKWSCSLIFSELKAGVDEKPDILAFGSHKSTIIECKISRSDFKRDQKKIFRSIPQRGMGRYRFYMCPTDLIKEDELPDKWGLIYVSDGGRCKLIKSPESQYCNLLAENAYMYSILRRLYNKNTNEIQTFFGRYT